LPLLTRTGSWGLSRLALVAVVIIAIVAASILAIDLQRGSTSKTSATSKSFQEIRITKVSQDFVDAPAGKSFYLLQLNASNLGPTTWSFNPGLLELTSNGSKGYSSDSNYNATFLMGKSSISPGNYTVGQVAFVLPSGQFPSRLRYSDQTAGVNVETESIPRVSAVASRFDFNVCLTINGNTANSCTGNGWTVNSFNGTSRWVGSLIVVGVITNNSLVFFTGQTIQVSLWFEYLKQPVDPVSIKIQSATNNDGLAVVGIQPSLPLTITGWGNSGDLFVLLRVPPGQHSGNLHFSVQFSA
jgi:hypothetical protein